jgi:hypothetical protein
MGSLPARWLPVDPELTQPGNRPSLVPTPDQLPAPVPPKRRRPWPAAVLALVLLVAGGLGGFTWWRGGHSTKTFIDDKNVLRVTVPASWGDDVSLAGWIPPGSGDGQPAISAGDRRDWQKTGQGVFVGIYPGDKIPDPLPQHPACGRPGKPDTKEFLVDQASTVITHGCGGVVLERVVLLGGGELLWVQVRDDTERAARHVADTVRTQGSLG